MIEGCTIIDYSPFFYPAFVFAMLAGLGVAAAGIAQIVKAEKDKP